MKKLKYKIEQISRKEIKDINYLKQSIFDGNIFIIKKDNINDILPENILKLIY